MYLSNLKDAVSWEIWSKSTYGSARQLLSPFGLVFLRVSAYVTQVDKLISTSQSIIIFPVKIKYLYLGKRGF